MTPSASNGSKRFRWFARMRVLAALASLAGLALATGHAFAQSANSLDALSVSKASSGRTVIKFTLKAPLPNPPAGFAIAGRPRGGRYNHSAATGGGRYRIRHLAAEDAA